MPFTRKCGGFFRFCAWEFTPRCVEWKNLNEAKPRKGIAFARPTPWVHRLEGGIPLHLPLTLRLIPRLEGGLWGMTLTSISLGKVALWGAKIKTRECLWIWSTTSILPRWWKRSLLSLALWKVPWVLTRIARLWCMFKGQAKQTENWATVRKPSPRRRIANRIKKSCNELRTVYMSGATSVKS